MIMKAIYKTVDYTFTVLPTPGVIEAEINRQREKGWQLMERSNLFPETDIKPMMMTCTFQSIKD